jgi:transaldolase
MQFFVDSADVEQIKKINDMGLADGVTTNPSLIKAAGKDHKKTIMEISSIVKGPISVETLSETSEGMIKEAAEYITWGKNIVIKIVMTPEGMKAVRALSKKGIKTNVTVIFSPMQALIAAKAGATYVSPFIGRLDDAGHIGMETLEQIRQVFDNYDFQTQILAASLRHPTHVLEAALIGADVATVPPDVLMKLFNHPLTDAGIKKFQEDAKLWKK